MSTSFNAAAVAASDERFARLRAETALFMRDHVLSLVSHDLRSPLNAIHSWAYVLERKIDAADAAAQRALAGIRSGIDQQVKLLEDAVDSTRSATRTLALQRAPFETRTVVDTMVGDVQRMLADVRGVSITVDTPLAGETCDGDRERVAQAVWVMLVFAVECSAPGAAVTVESRIDAGFWRTDIMCSMRFAALEDAELPHAFEPFARKQATLPREAGRIAWVLALPHRVATAHGGTFEQSPAVDAQASTLSLRLPMSAV